MTNNDTKTGPATVAETDKTADVKVERNPSSTYTIKSLAGNITKLEKLKMCTEEELKQLKKIHRATMERWIGGNLGL